MRKLSMRWMVVTTLSAVASHAVAQTTASGGPAGAPPTAASSAAPGASPAVPNAPQGSLTPAPNAAPAGVSAPTAGAQTDANTLSVQAAATDPSASAPASTGAAASAAAEPAGAVNEEDKPWIEQLKPVDNLAEFGVVTGLMFPSGSLNLQSQYAAHQTLSIAPELGVRGAYFPLKYVGAELEYVAGFSKTSDDSQGATLWALRGHVIGQYPEWRVTPFALLGVGRMGVFSNNMGNDGDPLLHMGIGAKAALTPSLLVRLDLRDNMTQKYGASNGSLTHTFEMLVGVSLVLGRPVAAAPAAAVDTDGDGLVDRIDRCPTEAGVSTDGCPVKDKDGDGIADLEDKCPEVAGNPPDGCPIIKDTDGDGIPDDKDKCIDVKGEQPEGCPSDKDSDQDGIVDAKDKCPNEAESRNGFEDADGCPDELPAQVKEFTGILKGIEFERDKAAINPSSLAGLDKSAQVLAEYPSLRVLITGHTDDTGGRDKNVQLSKARAEAVKTYFVSKGIDPSRIQTRGAGAEEPLDTNATAAGRQRNRRIELKLLKDSE